MIILFGSVYAEPVSHPNSELAVRLIDSNCAINWHALRGAAKPQANSMVGQTLVNFCWPAPRAPTLNFPYDAILDTVPVCKAWKHCTAATCNAAVAGMRWSYLNSGPFSLASKLQSTQP